MFLRYPALEYDVVGANGLQAADATGLVALRLALRAHPAGPRPGSRNTSTVCTGPPCLEHCYSRVESWAESGPVFCKEAERSARRWISASTA